MKLGQKIILPIALLIVVVSSAFVYILFNLKQQENIISTQGEIVRTLNGLNGRLIRQQEQTEYYVLAYRFKQSNAYLLSIYQAELDKSKTLDQMFSYITTTRGRELVKAYIDSRKEIESLKNDLVKAIDNGDPKQIALEYDKWNIQTQNIKAALSDIGAYNINSLENTLVSIGNIRTGIHNLIFVLIFLIFIAAFFIYFYLRTVVTIPIVKLAQFAREISNKNFKITNNIALSRKDELGMLSRAINVMLIELNESYSFLEKKVVDRTRDLEQAKAKDDAILASIGDGVAVADELGNLIYLNKNASVILGSDANQESSDTWQEKYGIFDPVTLKPFPANEMPLAIAVGGKVTTKLRMLVKNKNSPDGRFISVTATPVFLEGKSIGGVAIFRDITKENEIDKAKSEFVSLASHQLRTPLTTVKWYTEMILNGDAGKIQAGQKKYLEEIYRGNERMVELVNTLLDVSRIDLGTFVFESKPTDIMQIASSVIHEQKQKIKEKNLNIVESFPKDLPILSTDPKFLRMVFQNLVSNAVKYTPDKGTISVSLQSIKKGADVNEKKIGADSVLITVADTGYGIPASQQDKIYTKLFRADNVLEKDTDGTGLGLYIVKSIINNFGGTIWFDSVENKGTTFHVVLPLAKSKNKKDVSK